MNRKAIINILIIFISILFGILVEGFFYKESFNYYRLFFFVCLSYVLLFIFTNQNIVNKKLENLFLVICLIFGTCMIVLLPFNSFVSWDDEIHFSRSYELSFFGNDVVWTKSADDFVNRKIPIVYGYAQRKELIQQLNENHDYKNPVAIRDSNSFINPKNRVYVHQSFALWLTRTIGLPYHIQFLSGKFMNLFIYALAFYFAIKHAKLGKRLIAVIGLLPTTMLIATTYTYDAVFLSFYILGIVLIINEFIDKELKIQPMKMGLIALLMIWSTLPKAVYIPMFLLLFMLPKEKFYSKTQKRCFNIATIVLVFVMLSSFTIPVLSDVVTNNVLDADTRGGGTSVVGQVQYIVDNPITFTKLFLSTIGQEFIQMNLGRQTFVWLCHLGTYPNYLYYITVGLVLFAAFTDTDSKNRNISLSLKMKIIIFILYAAIVCELYLSIYLAYIRVGGKNFAGVQGRYFIPLLYPLFLCIRTTRIKLSLSPKWANSVTLTISSLLIGYGIYSYILYPFCCANL